MRTVEAELPAIRISYSARLPLLACLLTLPAVAEAQFNYSTSNGTITITRYRGPDRAVVIPNTINGLPVTSIGDWAFHDYPGNHTLNRITIPDGLTSIGQSAFENCVGLTNVAIPNSVTVIGDRAFSGCTSLISVTIPAGLTNISPFSFNMCQSLTSLTLPGSVTHIGFYAFYSCGSLSNFTIPTSVTSIGSEAFAYCGRLTSVSIPNSITNLGIGAFWSCTDLTWITVDALNARYRSVDGVLFNSDHTTLIQAPGGKAGTYTIPNSVTNIGAGAFGGSTRLTTVTVPDQVVKIEGKAFFKCIRLGAVYFKGNAPILESSSFAGATNTTIYYFPGSTGWGVTFGGRPTALWRPQMQTGNASLGVRTDPFGFNIAWAGSHIVVVEACTNLANPIWFPLQTNTLTGDSLYFSDPQWTNYPSRFYRIRSP